MYQIFARSWKDKYGNYKIGRKTNIEIVRSIEEARNICTEFNKTMNNRQIKTAYKYEFTKI